MRQLDIAEIHTKQAIQIEEGLSKESWENVQLLSSILVSLHKYEEAIPVLEKIDSASERKQSPRLSKNKSDTFICKKESRRGKKQTASKINWCLRKSDC